MADVDVPRTWSLVLQGAFWSGTGPAAAIRYRWRAKLFGTGIEWLDAEARVYWGRIVGDPEFSIDYPLATSPGDDPVIYPPSPDYPLTTGPGDDRFCGRCGAQAASSDVFCRSCGSRLH